MARRPIPSASRPPTPTRCHRHRRLAAPPHPCTPLWSTSAHTVTGLEGRCQVGSEVPLDRPQLDVVWTKRWLEGMDDEGRRAMAREEEEEQGRRAMESCAKMLEEKAQPKGALGTLETWAKRLAKLQRRAMPQASQFAYVCFCADHGLVKTEPCTPYPSSVTQKVATALASGGAAGAVMCATVGRVRHFRVVDVGMLKPAKGCDKNTRVASGTKNLVREHAMDAEQCAKALDVGRSAIAAFAEDEIHAVVLGEVGIGNTTSSSALLAAMTRRRPIQVCGRGSGLDEAGLEKKVKVVEAALCRHQSIVKKASESPMDVLQALGGLEIAAIVGAVLQAREDCIAVLVDGFIATVAALVAVRLDPRSADCLFLTTRSPEPGHAVAMAELMKVGIPKPPLDMDMRLGEGSAAALCIPIMAAAANVVSDMITLAEALSLPNEEDDTSSAEH